MDNKSIGKPSLNLLRASVLLAAAGMLSIIGIEKSILKAEPHQIAAASKEEIFTFNMLYAPLHWQDTKTGFAIGGFDTLAYFSQKQSKLGISKFQYQWRGSNWRFASMGNLLAFKRSPSIYIPKFAGYDPYALSMGILVEGHPAIWSIIDGQLLLFHNEVNRYLWLENTKRLKVKTQKNWRGLSLKLPRHKIDK